MAKNISLLLFAVMAVFLVSCPNDSVYNYQEQTVMYNISVFPAPVNGRIEFSKTKAQKGTAVKVYVLPDPGYIVDETNLRFRNKGKTGETPIMIPKSNAYFWNLEVENFDIEVSVQFVANNTPNTYTISSDRDIKNGFVVPNISRSSTGDTIQVYLFPKSGFVLKDGSLKVLDAATKQPMSGVSVSAVDFPPSFTMPGQNVIISAEFETADFSGLLSNAQKNLRASQYDAAADYYAEAYKKRSGQPVNEVNEVIFYHSLAQLGAILLDNQVREFLGTGKERLHFEKIPVSLDDWIADIDNGWPGLEQDQWFRRWKGIDYSINDNNHPKIEDEDFDNTDLKESKGYIVGYPPLWYPQPDMITDDIITPRIQVRTGVDRENSVDRPNGGFAGSFADYSLITGTGYRNTRQKLSSIVFWVFLSQNRDIGAINNFLEKIEVRLLGTTFESAATIAAELPANASVPLYPNLKNRFDLEKYYGAGNSTVGKAELDYIFGTLRALKASILYLRTYDWSIDLRPWLIDDIKPEDGLAQIMSAAFRLARPNNNPEYEKYWSNSDSRSKILPLRNKFMTIRTAGSMSKAKDEFSKALTMLKSSHDYWHGTTVSGGSVYSSQGKADFAWAKDGISAAKTALDGNGNFYFPKKFPKQGQAWPSNATADYAINMAAFFTSGAFDLIKLLTVERTLSGQNAPSMFKIPWYDPTDLEQEAILLPGDAVRVTAAIPNSDRSTVEGKDSWWGLYSLEVNTGNLRQIFPKGFEQNKYTGRDENKAFFYEVFPTIPLWPERPTYLIGPGSGLNRSAQDLYKYYHDLP